MAARSDKTTDYTGVDGVIRMYKIYFTPEEVFNLYCTEIGKPHTVILYYQSNGLIALEVLQVLDDIPPLKRLNIDFPKFLEFATQEFGGRYPVDN